MFQERLTRGHGSQCGYCTPGFVMSMYALLRTSPNPTTQEIEHALSGNYFAKDFDFLEFTVIVIVLQEIYVAALVIDRLWNRFIRFRRFANILLHCCTNSTLLLVI